MWGSNYAPQAWCWRSVGWKTCLWSPLFVLSFCDILWPMLSFEKRQICQEAKRQGGQEMVTLGWKWRGQDGRGKNKWTSVQLLGWLHHAGVFQEQASSPKALVLSSLMVPWSGFPQAFLGLGLSSAATAADIYSAKSLHVIFCVHFIYTISMLLKSFKKRKPQETGCAQACLRYY